MSFIFGEIKIIVIIITIIIIIIIVITIMQFVSANFCNIMESLVHIPIKDPEEWHNNNYLKAVTDP